MLNSIVTNGKANGKFTDHPSRCANSNGFLTDREIAEALRRLPLNDGERATLEALLRRDFLLPGEGRKGFVYASNASLAAETGKCIRTVQLHLSKLKRWGIVRRDRKNPRKLFINYRALFRKAHMEEELSRFTAPPVTLCFGCGREFSPRRPNQRHCNATCRKRAQRAREREKHAMRKSVTPRTKKRDTLSPASEAGFPRGGETRCTPGVKNFSPPPARITPGEPATEPTNVAFTSPPNKRRLLKEGEREDDNVREKVTVTEAWVNHPALKALCRRREQLQRLITAFSPQRVLRALKQADLQYSTDGRIRNAFGLIWTMCQDLDDTLLREREEAERRRREREERERRLRELQARGCKRCGFWDVDLSGYCYDCRSSGAPHGRGRGGEAEAWKPSSPGVAAAGGS